MCLAQTIDRAAASFDRSALTRPEDAEKIRRGGTLSGGERDSGLTGWVEYDFEIGEPGWFELFVSPGGPEIEYALNGDRPPEDPSRARIYGTSGSIAPGLEKVGNVWLPTGRSTLRLSKYHWTGFPRTRRIVLQPAPLHAAKSLRAQWRADRSVFATARCAPLGVLAGGLPVDARLTITSRTLDGKAVRSTPLRVPAGSEPRWENVDVACDQEGNFMATVETESGPAPWPDVRPVVYEVVDTSPHRVDATRRLVEEIDLAARPPDYASRDGTRVVRLAGQRYRESGEHGFTAFQRSGAAMRSLLPEPSWFAYRLAHLTPQVPHVVTVDYPDDAQREFVVSLREPAPLNYPVAAGVDTGGEYSLSHGYHTRELLFWPRAGEARVLFTTTHDGRRAAAARARVYRLDVTERAEPLVPASRHFLQWYEEGANFTSLFGGPDDYFLHAREAANRWIAAASAAGVSMVSPAVSVYDFALYPSTYNRVFARPDVDLLGRLLLLGQKYGVKILPEVHPRADELAGPPPAPGVAPAHLSRSKDGATNYFAGDGRTRSYPPLFNPLDASVRAWYLGMIRELLTRYTDAPALAGISLRAMPWSNPGFNNFHSADWGYDAASMQRFMADSNLAQQANALSQAGASSAEIVRSAAWLSANERERWLAWRCAKVAELLTEIVHEVRAIRPDLRVYLPVFQWGERADQSTALREAGLDLALLDRIDGLTVINAVTSYGRRDDDEVVTQRRRDWLLDGSVLRWAVPRASGPAFLSGGQYIEATDAIVPPAALGFAAHTKSTWTSAAAIPAGAHNLERFAVQLAETDAKLLGDGGNMYTLPEPALRSFLAEYRLIPARAFARAPGAQDPVAVWQALTGSTLHFYAVNRERYPVSVTLALTAASVRRLTETRTAPAMGGQMTLQLPPYGIAAYRAERSGKITAVTQAIPGGEQQRLQRQLHWLRGLDVAALSSAQRTRVASQAAAISNAYAQGRYWAARTALEHHTLLEIYRQVGAQPPELRNAPIAASIGAH